MTAATIEAVPVDPVDQGPDGGNAAGGGDEGPGQRAGQQQGRHGHGERHAHEYAPPQPVDPH